MYETTLWVLLAEIQEGVWRGQNQAGNGAGSLVTSALRRLRQGGLVAGDQWVTSETYFQNKTDEEIKTKHKYLYKGNPPSCWRARYKWSLNAYDEV